MNRLRILVALLIAWLFAFYNIERFSAPIDLTSIAYIMVPVMVVVTILASRLSRLQLGAVLAASIPLFVLLKALVGSRILGAALPVTVTEICALIITTALARRVSVAILEFEQAVARISFGHVVRPVEATAAGESELYREVRRARKHNRPLALVAVSVDESSIEVALDRMVQQAQQAMMRQYVLSSVSRTLCDELDDYNTIAQSNGHFYVLLPETTGGTLPNVIERLRSSVRERVGVDLQIGVATLPDDAVTFEGLTKKAIEQMLASPAASATPAAPALPQAVTRTRVSEKRNGHADR
jgi:GGDEF domain-containing protein